MKKLVYLFVFIVIACSSPSTVEPDINTIDPEDPSRIELLKVNLQFPHKDGLCNVGTDITAEESTVIFEWEASTIAESYTIYVTNLVSGSQIGAQTNDDKIGLRLDRATPYSWYVESTSGAVTVESDAWKFYNSGPGVETYAPFPATITAPNMAESVNPGTVTLQWSGSDVDNDIMAYDIYLGTTGTPEIHATDITGSELNVTVISGTIYYWKVITKDETGNTSESDTFQFQVL